MTSDLEPSDKELPAVVPEPIVEVTKSPIKGGAATAPTPSAPSIPELVITERDRFINAGLGCGVLVVLLALMDLARIPRAADDFSNRANIMKSQIQELVQNFITLAQVKQENIVTKYREKLELEQKKIDGATPAEQDVDLNLPYQTRWSKLLDHKFSVPRFGCNRMGQTPLHLALLYGYTSIAKILLRHGANPNVQGIYGHLPLHYACLGFCGNLDGSDGEAIEIIRLLLEQTAQYKCVLGSHTDRRKHKSAAEKQALAIENILANGLQSVIEPQAIFFAVALCLWSLHSAVLVLCLDDDMQKWVEANAQVRADILRYLIREWKIGLSTTASGGLTALHLAVKSDVNGNNLPVIDVLLSCSALNVNAVHEHILIDSLPIIPSGAQAIYLAEDDRKQAFVSSRSLDGKYHIILTEGQHVDNVAREQLQVLSDPGTKRSHHSHHYKYLLPLESRFAALHYALQSNHDTLALRLLNLPDISLDPEGSDLPLLALACAACQSSEVVKRLITQQANMRVHLPLRTSNCDLTAVDADTSTSIANRKHAAALHYAVMYDDFAMVEALLTSPGDHVLPNVRRSGDGFTPLHLACEMENMKIIKLLLDHGASLTQLSNGATMYVTARPNSATSHIRIFVRLRRMKLSSDEERSEDVDRNAVNGPSHVPQLNLSSLHDGNSCKAESIQSRSSLLPPVHANTVREARDANHKTDASRSQTARIRFAPPPRSKPTPSASYQCPIRSRLVGSTSSFRESSTDLHQKQLNTARSFKALENWQQSMESGALKILLVDVQEVLHAAIYLPASKMESEFSTSSSSPSETEETEYFSLVADMQEKHREIRSQQLYLDFVSSAPLKRHMEEKKWQEQRTAVALQVQNAEVENRQLEDEIRKLEEENAFERTRTCYTPRPDWDSIVDETPELSVQKYQWGMAESSSTGDEAKSMINDTDKDKAGVLERLDSTYNIANKDDDQHADSGRTKTLVKEMLHWIERLQKHCGVNLHLSRVQCNLSIGPFGWCDNHRSNITHFWSPSKRRSEYIMALGTHEAVPLFLRHRGKLKRRVLKKIDVEKVVRKVWVEKRKREQRNPLGRFSLEQVFWDSEIEMFLLCLTGAVSDLVYVDQEQMIQGCQQLLLRLCELYNVESFVAERRVLLKDALVALRTYFPLKTSAQLQAIEQAIIRDMHKMKRGGNDSILYIDDILPLDVKYPLGFFVKTIRTQHFKEIQDYYALLLSELEQRDTEQRGILPIAAVRDAILAIDPLADSGAVQNLIMKALHIKTQLHHHMREPVLYKAVLRKMNATCLMKFALNFDQNAEVNWRRRPGAVYADASTATTTSTENKQHRTSTTDSNIG
ncbi:Ankyrin repeat-containing domain [Phytophthora cactorum]|nr:Ankyrin repeat-containing domain [Phytophthora cactorum]